jgi:hypothetical protein
MEQNRLVFPCFFLWRRQGINDKTKYGSRDDDDRLLQLLEPPKPIVPSLSIYRIISHRE